MKNLCLLAIAIAMVMSANAQTYTYSTLASFKAGGPSSPTSLIIDGSGDLYGTGSGSVFKVTPKGAVTVLFSFTTNPGANSLVRDSRQGKLYGITVLGGVEGGTVFRMTPGKGGKYTFSTLYTASGFYPRGVTLDSSGDLYGTANCPDGLTCIFEISTDGQWMDLYECCAGGAATSNLLVDKTGFLYAGIGFTQLFSYGSIVEYPSGNCCSVDFDSVVSSLRQDALGNIYGAQYGGNGAGAYMPGTVFELNATTGIVSTLYTFCSLPDCADGEYPANLTLDSKGNIYGTNSVGVFKLTSAGVESVIYNSGQTYLGPGLVMDKSGNLYGTTLTGGSNGLGSVFKLTKN